MIAIQSNSIEAFGHVNFKGHHANILLPPSHLPHGMQNLMCHDGVINNLSLIHETILHWVYEFLRVGFEYVCDDF